MRRSASACTVVAATAWRCGGHKMKKLLHTSRGRETKGSKGYSGLSAGRQKGRGIGAANNTGRRGASTTLVRSRCWYKPSKQALPGWVWKRLPQGAQPAQGRPRQSAALQAAAGQQSRPLAAGPLAAAAAAEPPHSLVCTAAMAPFTGPSRSSGFRSPFPPSGSSEAMRW